MSAAVAVSIFFVFFVLLLYVPVIIKILIHNNELTIKLVILKVIKINIKEKTTFEKLKKNRIKKDNVPIKTIIEIVIKSLPSIRYLASRIKINIKIIGTLGLSSADKTALTIGILNVILYNMESIFRNYLKNYTGEYKLTPDFVNEVLKHSTSAEVYIKPVNVIVFLIKWLKVLLKYKKYILRKGGASNARSSNRRIDENYNG